MRRDFWRTDCPLYLYIGEVCRGFRIFVYLFGLDYLLVSYD